MSTKRIPGKSFRLIDFVAFDNTPSTSDSDSVGSNSANAESTKFNIQMFGINEAGDTASITIYDYYPFFYVKVSDDWTQSSADDFLVTLQQNNLFKKIKTSILSATLEEYNKLYGFTAGKKSKFVKLVFENMDAFNSVKRLWYTTDKSGARKLTPYTYEDTITELYESGIPPLLRYFHIQNISPSGWVTVSAKPTLDKKTSCTYEYVCSQKKVISMPDKETRVPYKICSFDIEASSSHGDFPVPVKTYKKLASNIVDIFRYQGSTDKARNTVLIQNIIMTAFGYAKFDDVDLVYTKNEKPSKTEIAKLIKLFLSRKITEDLNSIKLLVELQTLSYDNRQEEDENDEVADELEEPDSDTEEYKKPKFMQFEKKTKKQEEKLDDILAYIMSDSVEYDTKVQLSDTILTQIFPKLEGDKVTFIGSTFMKYGESEPYKNHCIVLGTCDNVPNVEIQTADTEKDLLIKWKELIQTENPDIIVGYNIFGFDYEFMLRRAEETECIEDFVVLSRKTGEKTAKYVCDSKTSSSSWNLDSTKVALASGEYDLRYFKMTGRLQIDMLAYCRREFNWSSYKLDDVASTNISDTINKIEITENGKTRLYTKNIAGLSVNDFIHIEMATFSSDYYADGAKFPVEDIELIGKEAVLTIHGHHDVLAYAKKRYNGAKVSVKWGMSKDDVSPQDIFRLTNGSASDRAIVAKYCIQDCNLVHHLMRKLDVVTGYVEMARICSVPISFLVLRGQGIKLTSYVAKKCRDYGTLMPDLDKGLGDGGYEGAIVLPPKCKMYMDNPVACVDYSSLYPSSMISQNYSHDSKVWTKEYDLDGNLIKVVGERSCKCKNKLTCTHPFTYDQIPGYEYIHTEFDTYEYKRPFGRPTAAAVKTKVGKMVCCWAQLPNGQKSIMPSILEELLKARKTTRKMSEAAAENGDIFLSNVLDKRQLGYKVTANSLYGQCGARTSTFYEKDVAACTTATGRMMITYAKRIIEEVYGDRVYETACQGAVRCRAEYVYGDTDSVFFTFNLENPTTGKKIRGKPALEATIEIAQDAAQLCTDYLKPPMALAYEKTLMPFILLSKKRYVGMLYEEDPNKGKLKFMGLVLKRRDNCDLVKDVYGGVLNILMNQNSVKAATEYLTKCLNELVDGQVPMDKLTITKALRGYYKNPQQIAHRVLANRMGKRDPGNKPKAGDRIKYAYVQTESKKALQGDKIETPEYIIEAGLKIDYTHYITNQLMKPLLQLFGLALEQILEENGTGRVLREFNREIARLEKECPDLEKFMKMREKLTSAKVKELLFKKILDKIHNERNGIRTLFDCYNK